MTMPLRRSTLLAALVLLAGCDRHAASVADLGGRVSVLTTDSIAVLAHEAYSGYRSSARLVVADPEAWAAAWQQVYAMAVPQPALPVVDFPTDAVLIAAAGERTSGGFDVRIDSIVVLGSGTEVHITTLSAGAGCVSTAALTQPVHVVRVPALRAPVQFVERVAVVECD